MKTQLIIIINLLQQNNKSNFDKTKSRNFKSKQNNSQIKKDIIEKINYSKNKKNLDDLFRGFIKGFVVEIIPKEYLNCAVVTQKFKLIIIRLNIQQLSGNLNYFFYELENLMLYLKSQSNKQISCSEFTNNNIKKKIEININIFISISENKDFLYHSNQIYLNFHLFQSNSSISISSKSSFNQFAYGLMFGEQLKLIFSNGLKNNIQGQNHTIQKNIYSKIIQRIIKLLKQKKQFELYGPEFIKVLKFFSGFCESTQSNDILNVLSLINISELEFQLLFSFQDKFTKSIDIETFLLSFLDLKSFQKQLNNVMTSKINELKDSRDKSKFKNQKILEKQFKLFDKFYNTKQISFNQDDSNLQQALNLDERINLIVSSIRRKDQYDIGLSLGEQLIWINQIHIIKF